jgi:6-bladed beta-propeller/FlgD Ig-like domain
MEGFMRLFGKLSSSIIVLIMVMIISGASCLYASEYPSINFENSITAGLNSPSKLCADLLGRIFVSEPGFNRVSIYSKYGFPIGTINNINHALGISISNDKLYVGSDHIIEIYDLITFEKTGEIQHYFEQINAIESDEFGQLYVVDSKADKIKVFTSEGFFLHQFGSSGSGSGELNFPVGIAIDEGADKVFIGDQGNSRIVVYDLNGNFITEFGQHTFQNPTTFEWVFEATFSFIQGVACDENGRLFIVDSYQSNIQVLDYSGNCLGFIGMFGDGPGEFKLPMDICWNSGNLIVTSQGNSKIDVFSSIVTSVDDNGESESLPVTFKLAQNYPNPFNAETKIDFYLEEPSKVNLSIYNILGQHVKTLIDMNLPAGNHSIEWDSTNDLGNSSSSGIYFYQLKNDVGLQSKRMVLLK